MLSQAEVPSVALEERGRSGDPERDCPRQEVSFSSLGLEEAEWVQSTAMLGLAAHLFSQALIPGRAGSPQRSGCSVVGTLCEPLSLRFYIRFHFDTMGWQAVVSSGGCG